LNGTRLPIKSFADYCDLYLGPKENGVPRIHERVNDRWELVISATDGQFQQVGVSAQKAQTTNPPAEAAVIHQHDMQGLQPYTMQCQKASRSPSPFDATWPYAGTAVIPDLSHCCLQVSFANSICTSKGGTHVNYVVDQITK
jgi:hypothetical protein